MLGSIPLTLQRMARKTRHCRSLPHCGQKEALHSAGKPMKGTIKH
jgi:hypothetical protein